ncbi:hypothetical protein LUZ60_015205 [Juncus effusus]|nr:hypothetical protein LUZ60_015205 [Juncus effusus]
MPSRRSLVSAPFPSITPPSHSHSHSHHARSLPTLSVTALSISASVAVFLSLLFLLLYLLRRRNHLSRNPNPTNPDSNIPTSIQRLPSSLLRRATASFSPSNKLGHGGFGPVYRGLLPASSKNKELERTQQARPVAIKLMDSSSLQGDREFLNELTLSSLIPPCPSVLLPFAFSLSSPNPNNGFFPSPFHSSCFNRGKGNTSPPSDRNCMMLVYDLMPNGSLQDALLGRKSPEMVNSWPRRFSVATDVARALFFLHEICDPPVIHGDVKPSNVLLDSDFSAKLADFGLARHRSSIEKEEEEQEEGDEKDELNDEASELGTATNNDADMDESNPATSPPAESTSKTNGIEPSTKDWWWRQDDAKSTNSKNGPPIPSENTNRSDPSVKKDYVMEWIRSEIKSERPKREWWAQSSKPSHSSTKNKELEKSSRRPSREWWREEFTEELSNKHKSRTNSWFLKDGSGSSSSKRKLKIKSWSRASLDRWIDRTNGSDQVVPKSGATVSSTPSMRGTVCYVAPEYGGGGPVSEKCDIYSYGVLLLVIVSGRRPLQVAPLASPAQEFERASLVSWARHLAHMGRLGELVDPELRDSVGAVDRDQVVLCVTVALLCIQRVPARRPSAGEVVRILSGEGEAPVLPVEFSPSPPGGGFSFKRRKKNGG